MKTQKSLGITLSYDFIPPALCNDLLRVLDDSSFTHLFVPEIWGRDAFTQITSMSHHTSLVLGTGIVNLYSRTPATLAQTAAGLHELTDGKFILGLGLSDPIVIQDWHGVDYYHPSPLRRTREYLEILRLIFTGERVNYNGQLFSLKNFRLNYETPVDIPLFLAAMGSKNVQLAGELADGWLPIWTSYTLSPNPKMDLEKGFAKRNPKLRTIDIAPYIITVASDSEKAKKLVQKHLAYYIGGMGTFYYQNMKRLGFATEADRIKTAWDVGDRETAARSVSQNMVERVAIVGKPEDVVDRYHELNKSGVNLPVVMPPFGCPPELAMDTITAFSEL